MSSRSVRLAGLAALGVLALLAASGRVVPVGAQDHAPHGGQVAELFRAACASCHVAPDPAIDTDRAWLQQVEDTA